MKISLKNLPTVGKKRLQYLNKIGIYTLEDLLFYFPAKIEDRRSFNFENLSEKTNDKITIIGKILTYKEIVAKERLGLFKVVVETVISPKKIFTLVWYKKLNKKYDVFLSLKKKLEKNYYILAYGKPIEGNFSFPEIRVEDYEVFEDLGENTIHTNRLVPIYSLSENISQQWFRELMYSAINNFKLDEYMPKRIILEERFLDLNTAIKNIHFPDTWQLYNEAKRRLIFDKFLLLQLAILKTKQNIISKKKVGNYVIKRHLLTPFKEKLKKLIPNFEFTKAQKKVINELFKDMMSDKPMNRLLIGDVGSGKTIVAISCALLAIENGYQVAFMAPTEILAEQHYYNLESYIGELYDYEKNRKINASILTSKTSKKQKEKILKDIENGVVDIVVGTHALINPKVKFKNLSLVIIDEQHKFGVIQRKKLYEKSELPDILIMTATPIPRSLAMTIYGELDISIINELPHGRKPVKTMYYDIEKYDYKFVIEQLNSNAKVYMVYPVIEETKSEIRTLIEEYEKLSNTVFKNYKCGLLHGRLRSFQKQQIMEKFRKGEYQVLFTTSVIEVGIDVPDATVIVINHAERYGLAQLHQLRGRVGRSEKQSYCILLGKLTTEEAKRRINIMLSTNNGFEIANEDLLIRGPGSIFGTLQHGVSEVDFSEILKYPDLLYKSKKYAEEIVFNKKFDFREVYQLFKKVYLKYANNFNLGSIG
ncbi:MAG: ATP-dependent DNA helicase RecG [Endomicrobiia bacterium]